MLAGKNRAVQSGKFEIYYTFFLDFVYFNIFGLILFKCLQQSRHRALSVYGFLGQLWMRSGGDGLMFCSKFYEIWGRFWDDFLLILVPRASLGGSGGTPGPQEPPRPQKVGSWTPRGPPVSGPKFVLFSCFLNELLICIFSTIIPWTSFWGVWLPQVSQQL